MTVSAPFFVKDANGNIVPAQFMTDLNGNPIVNPNTTLNTINHYDNQYFDSKGNSLQNFNSQNYIVCPLNYNIQNSIQFGNSVATIMNNSSDPSTGYTAAAGMMTGAFIGVGPRK